ncbi:hypothetical protein Tco_0789217 [Tanacetum coccineum]
MSPRMTTRSVGRPATASRGGGTGARASRGGGRTGSRSGNQGNSRNDGQAVVKFTSHYCSPSRRPRNVIENNDHKGCTYKEFLACNTKEYDGKGGSIVYTRWIENMESVQDMSGCEDNQKKLETELWNHTMVGASHAAYTDRFHELARGEVVVVRGCDSRGGGCRGVRGDDGVNGVVVEMMMVRLVVCEAVRVARWIEGGLAVGVETWRLGWFRRGGRWPEWWPDVGGGAGIVRGEDEGDMCV